MGCFKNYFQGCCSKSGYFYPRNRATYMVHFPDQIIHPKVLSSEPYRIQPHHSREYWLATPTSTPFLSFIMEPPLWLGTQICSERKHFSTCSQMRYKWKCYMDFLKSCLKGRVIKLGEVPFLPFCGMQQKREGWSFSSHFGVEGTVHRILGSDDIAETEPCFWWPWNCSISPGLLCSMLFSCERETNAPISSAVIWDFSIVYSCMQFLTDMLMNNKCLYGKLGCLQCIYP